MGGFRILLSVPSREYKLRCLPVEEFSCVGRANLVAGNYSLGEDGGVRLHPQENKRRPLPRQRASVLPLLSSPLSFRPPLTWSSTRQLPKRAPLPKTARCTRVVVTTNTIFPSSMGCCRGSFLVSARPALASPRLSRPPSSLAWHTSCCCGGSIGLLLLPAATAVAVQPLLSCQIGDRDQNSLLLLCLLLLFTLPVFLEYVPRRYGNRQARTETLVPTLQTMHHYCRVLRAVRGSVVLCFGLHAHRGPDV